MLDPGILAPTALTPLDDALDALFTLGVTVTGATRCSLYLRASHDDTVLGLYRQRGLRAPEVAVRIPSAGTVAGLVMQSRAPLLVDDVTALPDLPSHPDRYHTSSFISVPVVVEDTAVGVLSAADRHDGAHFSEEDLRGAELVARSMATVLYHDLLTRRLLDGASVDPVTGLGSRDALTHRLRHEQRLARRQGTTLSVLLLAAGTYTDVAERVGTQVAALLLRQVGQMVWQLVGGDKLVARVDIDTLAVLLPGMDSAHARETAALIVREIVHEHLPAALRYECEDLQLVAGLASDPASPAGSRGDVLARATLALGLARARGGSTIVASEDEASATDPDDAPAGLDLDDKTGLSPGSVGLTLANRPHLAGVVLFPGAYDLASPDDEEAVEHALHLGIPYLAAPGEMATQAALDLLDPATARAFACLPIAYEARTLTVAMANPLDALAIRAVSLATRMAVAPVLSTRAEIERAIDTLMVGPRPTS